MPNRLGLAVAMLAACSSPTPAKGHIVVALTIDWEGAAMTSDSLDAIDALRKSFGGAPLTHFVSAAYFTKAVPDPTAVDTITAAVHPGDELAVHLHAWRSLAQASGISPKLSPSFLTGTDALLAFDDGDTGFDTDLDAYSVVDLRAMLRMSRTLLERTQLPVSQSFRAGGYLATPKVFEAMRAEGFRVDSSATAARQLDAGKDGFLTKRLEGVWPDVQAGTQPYLVHQPSGDVTEVPIAAIADYATAAQVVAAFDAAHVRLQATPDRDVFVVLAFHQETATEFVGRLAQAIATVQARPEIASELKFTTIQGAAALAHPHG